MLQIGMNRSNRFVLLNYHHFSSNAKYKSQTIVRNMILPKKKLIHQVQSTVESMHKHHLVVIEQKKNCLLIHLFRGGIVIIYVNIWLN